MSDPIRKPDEFPSRSESILSDTIGLEGYSIETPPRSRIETLLIELKEIIGQGGGGSSTAYATSLEITMDEYFVMSATLKNKDGDTLGQVQTVDLPLESVVVNGSYDSINKNVVLTLENGNTISFSVADLVSGLQTEITSNNKLDADLVDDANSTHKFATEAQLAQIQINKTALDNKADKSTTYTKTEVDMAISGKVDKETGKSLSTNDYTTTEKTKLAGIEEGAEVNVQANWTQITPTADDFIKNKPTLGTAAALDVAASGNASTSQVVKGNDTRLTDPRNAADVSSWAKAANKPSYNGSEIALTGYTEAQSKSSVVATDTANAAIGKLEYRVETNENNISYNTNNGVKNIWKLTIPESLPSGFTITEDTDGGYIFNGTAGSSGVTCSTAIYFGKGKYILSGCPSGGSDDTYRLDILRGANTNYCYGKEVVVSGFTPSSSYQCRIRIAPNYTCNNLKFYPMIRPATIEDPSYQPYALPNSELTALSAEDRAALVELVDNGAKNIADLTSTTKTTYTTATSNGVTITRNGDIFTVSGTSDTNNNIFFNIYYEGIASTKIIPPGNWVGLIEDYTGSVVKDIAVQFCTPDTAISSKDYGAPAQFSLSGSESGNWLRVNLRPSTTYDGSFRLMICSKAAWDISHEYQPYRPSEDEQNVIINSKANLENIAYKTAASSFSETNMQVIFDENMFSQSNFRGSVLMMFGTQKTSVSNTLLLVDFYDGGIKSIRYLTSGTGEVITAIGTIHNNKHGFDFTADANSYTYPCCLSLFANKDIQPKFTVSVVT